MIYAMVEDKSVFTHRLAALSQNVSVAAVTVIFFRTLTNKHFVKQKRAAHRSCSNFHPPLKNVSFTVGVKSISKMWFLRSMGSIKKYVSYGAWEAIFWVLQHLRSETTTFFLAFIPQRGAKKCEIAFLRSMGSKKKNASYGAWEAYFWFLQHLSSVLKIFLTTKWPLNRYQSSWEGVYIYKE